MKVKIINKTEFGLPEYETKGSAAFDIRANFVPGWEHLLLPNERISISTGLFVSIPTGCALLISGRSGNAMNYGVTVTQGYGLIDSDYRGEIKVFLSNHGKDEFLIKHGQRIAQGLIIPMIQAEWVEVNTLDETARGTGGFGHTGIL